MGTAYPPFSALASAFSFLSDFFEIKVTSRDLLKRRVIICEFKKCFRKIIVNTCPQIPPTFERNQQNEGLLMAY